MIDAIVQEHFNKFSIEDSLTRTLMCSENVDEDLVEDDPNLNVTTCGLEVQSVMAMSH